MYELMYKIERKTIIELNIITTTTKNAQKGNAAIYSISCKY